MSKILKRILLGANFLLVGVVCYAVVSIVNNQATEVSEKRVAGICNHIVANVSENQMSLDDARNYVVSKSTVGSYVPVVEIVSKAGMIWIETDDPALTNSASNTLSKINCSEKITS